MRETLAKLGNSLEFRDPGVFEIANNRAPNEAERQALTMLRAELRDALRPAGLDASIDLMKEFFEWFSSFGAKQAEWVCQVMLYAEAISGEPQWAIQRMMSAVESAGVETRPSLPKVVKLTRDLSEQVSRDLKKIDAILGAQIYQTSTPRTGKELMSERIRKLTAAFDIKQASEPRFSKGLKRREIDAMRRMAGDLSASEMLRRMKEGRPGAGKS